VPYKTEINWTSATVIAENDRLRLRVQVVPDPDPHWRDAFDDIAQRVSSEIGRLPGGTRIDSLSSNMVTVRGFPPDTEDLVRTTLDDVVIAVNEEAEALKSEWDEDQAKKAAKEQALQQAADEATARFRSPG